MTDKPQKQEHTPGPWRIVPFNENQVAIVETENAGGRIIAVVDKADGQDKANARLLAASVDLLEAAKKLRDLWRQGKDPDGASVAAIELRDAIAKAEGEAQR